MENIPLFCGIAEMKNEINCLDFSEDGSAFATSGKDLCVRIYDTKTCQVSTFISCYILSLEIESIIAENTFESGCDTVDVMLQMITSYYWLGTRPRLLVINSPSVVVPTYRH